MSAPTVDLYSLPAWAWHDLGAGWQRAIVTLADGETATNPSSTKAHRAVRGPAVVVYDRAPSGVVCHVYDDAAGFYGALA